MDAGSGARPAVVDARQDHFGGGAAASSRWTCQKGRLASPPDAFRAVGCAVARFGSPLAPPAITARNASVTTLNASSADLDLALSGWSALASSRYRALYPSRDVPGGREKTTCGARDAEARISDARRSTSAGRRHGARESNARGTARPAPRGRPREEMCLVVGGSEGDATSAARDRRHFKLDP